jgi:hypothetical protein
MGKGMISNSDIKQATMSNLGLGHSGPNNQMITVSLITLSKWPEFRKKLFINKNFDQVLSDGLGFYFSQFLII